MIYETAEELAAHLSMTIDDEDFILRAVQLKFPQYGTTGRSHKGSRKGVGEIPPPQTTYARRTYGSELNQANDWYCSGETDRAFHRMLTTGSTRLLTSIHNEHPSIMQALREQGRQVVMP